MIKGSIKAISFRNCFQYLRLEWVGNLGCYTRCDLLNCRLATINDTASESRWFISGSPTKARALNFEFNILIEVVLGIWRAHQDSNLEPHA